MKKIPKLKNIRNIVIFRTDRIGEVLLATPVIEALKRKFPQARLSFVTSAYARDIVADRIDLHEVITFDTIDRKVSLRGVLALSSQLRKRRFDMAVILNSHKALHLAVFLAGIRYCVGFDRKWGFLLNYRVKDEREEAAMHEVMYNLEPLKLIGVDEKDIAPFVNVLSRNSYYVSGLLQQCGINPDKKTIAIHPGSSNPAKRWPVENFTELVKRLAGFGGFNIIAVGDRSEKELCEKVIPALGSKSVFSLAGLLTLKDLAAFFKKTDLLITNDNGPMHIAACVGAKVIAIFGRNMPGVSPKRWGPYGDGHIVFHKDPGCRPCYDKKCPYDFKCLRSITPDEVFEAAKRVLG